MLWFNDLLGLILRRPTAHTILKNHYIFSGKTSINNSKNAYKKQDCNSNKIR